MYLTPSTSKRLGSPAINKRTQLSNPEQKSSSPSPSPTNHRSTHPTSPKGDQGFRNAAEHVQKVLTKELAELETVRHDDNRLNVIRTLFSQLIQRTHPQQLRTLLSTFMNEYEEYIAERSVDWMEHRKIERDLEILKQQKTALPPPETRTIGSQTDISAVPKVVPVVAPLQHEDSLSYYALRAEVLKMKPAQTLSLHDKSSLSFGEAKSRESSNTLPRLPSTGRPASAHTSQDELDRKGSLTMLLDDAVSYEEQEHEEEHDSDAPLPATFSYTLTINSSTEAAAVPTHGFQLDNTIVKGTTLEGRSDQEIEYYVFDRSREVIKNAEEYIRRKERPHLSLCNTLVKLFKRCMQQNTQRHTLVCEYKDMMSMMMKDLETTHLQGDELRNLLHLEGKKVQHWKNEFEQVKYYIENIRKRMVSKTTEVDADFVAKEQQLLLQQWEEERQPIEDKLRAEKESLETDVYNMKHAITDLRTSLMAENSLRKDIHNLETPIVINPSLSELTKTITYPRGNLAIVFVSVFGNEECWAKMPNLMKAASSLYDSCVRQSCSRLQGQIVRKQGDIFQIAFPRSSHALAFCLTVQDQLLQQEWDPRLQQHKHCTMEQIQHNGKLQWLWRGLRVKMSANYGRLTSYFDPISSKQEHFGVETEKALRMLTVTAGGMITVSQQFHDDVQDQFVQLGNPAVYPYGLFLFRGVPTPIQLSVVLPRQLDKRFKLWSEYMGQMKHQYSPMRLMELQGLIDANVQHKFDLNDMPIKTVLILKTTAAQTTQLQADLQHKIVAEILSAFRYTVEHMLPKYPCRVGARATDRMCIVFEDGITAVQFALDIQHALMKADWPQPLLDHPTGAAVKNSVGTVTYCGLRVQIGISKGPVVCVDDLIIHDRVNFLGPTVIQAAMLCKAATGGEVIISTSVHDEVHDDMSKQNQAPVFLKGRPIKRKSKNSNTGTGPSEPCYMVFSLSLVGRLYNKTHRLLRGANDPYTRVVADYSRPSHDTHVYMVDSVWTSLMSMYRKIEHCGSLCTLLEINRMALEDQDSNTQYGATPPVPLVPVTLPDLGQLEYLMLMSQEHCASGPTSPHQAVSFNIDESPQASPRGTTPSTQKKKKLERKASVVGSETLQRRQSFAKGLERRASMHSLQRKQSMHNTTFINAMAEKDSKISLLTDFLVSLHQHARTFVSLMKAFYTAHGNMREDEFIYRWMTKHIEIEAECEELTAADSAGSRNRKPPYLFKDLVVSILPVDVSENNYRDTHAKLYKSCIGLLNQLFNETKQHLGRLQRNTGNTYAPMPPTPLSSGLLAGGTSGLSSGHSSPLSMALKSPNTRQSSSPTSRASLNPAMAQGIAKFKQLLDQKVEGKYRVQ